MHLPEATVTTLLSAITKYKDAKALKAKQAKQRRQRKSSVSAFKSFVTESHPGRSNWFIDAANIEFTNEIGQVRKISYFCLSYQW
jgi:hypothetical protein